jgi:hypothetical protein
VPHPKSIGPFSKPHVETRTPEELQRFYARFWSRVEIPIRPDGSQDADACWKWQGAVQTSGYGYVYLGRKNATGNPDCDLTHRVAYEHRIGRLPDGLILRHAAGCPRRCCNPLHLTPGTQGDNMADLVKAKGRYGNAKLTPEAVYEIRRAFFADEMSVGDIAAAFGVAKQTVCNALNGDTWKHVPFPPAHNIDLPVEGGAV